MFLTGLLRQFVRGALLIFADLLVFLREAFFQLEQLRCDDPLSVLSFAFLVG